MNFVASLSQGQAIIVSLTAAFLWGTWFVSIKKLGDFPVAAFYLELFITSFVLVWTVGLIVDGTLIFTNISELWKIRPSKIVVVYVCGILYVLGMSISIKVLGMIGLTLSQPLQSSIALVIGTFVTTFVGGIPEGYSINRILLTALFILFSIFFVTLAQREKSNNQSIKKIETGLSKDPKIMKEAIKLMVLAALFIPAYTLGLSYGLKTITQPQGLAVLPYMCLLVTGALTGAILSSGISLTRNHQWGCFRKTPFSVHKYGILSGCFHYGGNIIHTFATGVLSSSISWPLGLTASLWTQVWGLVSGEFKGASAKAYIYQLVSFSCYIIGAYILIFS